MNQPIRRVNPVPAPFERDETVPRTLAADARCVVKHLALYLGRVARAQRLALLCGVGAASPIGRLRRTHVSNLG